MVFALGYRYRLHEKRLPGKPDLVFKKRKKVIFVHGCFWHSHECKIGQTRPKTNVEFWNNKLDRNIERDGESQRLLTEMGWKYLVLWECELSNTENISNKVRKFLGPISERSN